MTWTPWAILAGLVLEAISAWIERHAVRVDEHTMHPEFRFIQWGSHVNGDHGVWHMGTDRWRWFLMIKLPSYQWGRTDYGRHWGWWQLCLIWEEGNGWKRSGYWPL